MATKKNENAKKESPKQKPLGKCALFTELLKNSPQGLDWQTVETQTWNSDTHAHYPGTFGKLVKEGLAYRKDKKMFWGKPPAEKKNGKSSKKGDKLAAGTV